MTPKKLLLTSLILGAAWTTLQAADETTLRHRSGETTTVRTTRDGSTTTGWYGGRGGEHSRDSHQQAVRNVRDRAAQHGNPVVRSAKSGQR